jgi:glutathione S-transferase
MKLRHSPTSPYVRKVAVAIHELGLNDKVEFVATAPWDAKTDLGEINPLGKVPTLVTDDHQVLYDSPVICEYLDALVGGRLFPPGGPDRWTALRRQALGDGLMDAAVLARLESQRPADRQSADWIGRQRAAVARTLDALESEAAALAGPLTIGHVAIGCALGYLDFRFAEDEWRKGRPGLAGWYRGFASRPSMTSTVPPA